ncbi:hypothetical protein ACFY4C_16485 [Actinomadura viridis]|uniref:hypothetical protein n=1 Tax=Actinomadura viridis TaxID=58110 RepID=UPI0036AB3F41
MFYQDWRELESILRNKTDTAGLRKTFYLYLLALLASTACSAKATKSEASPAPLPTTRDAAISKAKFGSNSTVSSLPNTAKNIENVIPRELSSTKRWTAPFDDPRTDQFHVWNLFTSLQSRILDVNVRKMENIKEAKEGVAHERSKMANYTRETKLERLVTGSPRPVKGLGAECLSFSIERNNAAPMSGGDGTRYSVSGVRMYCRVMNVGVSIQWEGMDYPSPGVTDRGKGLSYKSAEKQAIEIMKPIISSLTPER